jgi:hypothetical protein
MMRADRINDRQHSGPAKAQLSFDAVDMTAPRTEVAVSEPRLQRFGPFLKLTGPV